MVQIRRRRTDRGRGGRWRGSFNGFAGGSRSRCRGLRFWNGPTSERTKSVSLEAAVQKAVASVVARPRGVGGGKDRLIRIRDRHHQMARMISANVPRQQICKVMGITERSLEMLAEQTPAFIELVAHYRARASTTLEIVEYIDMMNANMLAAEQILRDQLMESGDEMSPSVLSKLAMDRADRLGYGKQSTHLNVNVDFASAIEAARKRSGKQRQPPSAVGAGGESSTVAEQSSSPPLLELKAEPAAASSHEPVSPAESRVASPHPCPPGTRHPTEGNLNHPTAKFLYEKYRPVAERIEGYQEIERRL